MTQEAEQPGQSVADDRAAQVADVHRLGDVGRAEVDYQIFLRIGERHPEAGIGGAWREFKTIQLNPHSAVPGKYKELIGLAVAAQIQVSRDPGGMGAGTTPSGRPAATGNGACAPEASTARS